MACANYTINVADQDNLDVTLGKEVTDLVKKFDGSVKHEFSKAHKFYVSVPTHLGDGFKEAADDLFLKSGLTASVEHDKTPNPLFI
ncbi:hypothetical protein MOSE0_G08724 [Monosporozyma servazzii]